MSSSFKPVEISNRFVVRETVFLRQAKAGPSRFGPFTEVTLSNPMLVCEVGDEELGSLFYDDLGGDVVNVNGIAFDDSLSDEDRGAVARSLLRTLMSRTGSNGTPRLSFVKEVRGRFWSDLEREGLLLIDSRVRRRTV